MMNGVVDKLCFNISIRNLICFGLVLFARCVGEYWIILHNSEFDFVGKIEIENDLMR